MQEYNTIIGKLLAGINRSLFRRLVLKYNGDRYVKHFNTWSQFVCIFIGQIGQLSSLREIVDAVNFQANNQYQLGIKKLVSKSTFAEANERIDWRIYRDLFLKLVYKLPQNTKNETENVIEIIDSTPIYLNLLNHPWIETTMKVKGLKTHVVYNWNENLPVVFDITGARTNDITWAKQNVKIQKNVTYIVDKGYTDYNWWFEINTTGATFVTRLKKDAQIKNIGNLKITDENVSSQMFVLTNKRPGGKRINNYANIPLKKVYVNRSKEGKSPLVLVTNDFKRSDKEIAELYKQRWQIELFFKWIKQNLKIKKFLGRSENAIKTQICIAMISYVLLYLMNELREICKNISLKNLLKIIGNNMFYTLKPRKYGRKKYKDPNQLQFLWLLSS